MAPALPRAPHFRMMPLFYLCYPEGWAQIHLSLRAVGAPDTPMEPPHEQSYLPFGAALNLVPLDIPAVSLPPCVTATWGCL